MINRLVSLTVLMFAIVMLLAPMHAKAEDPISPVCEGNNAISAACQARTKENPLLGPSGIITKVIQILALVTGVISVLVIMIGGFRYIISTGDPAKVNSAKDTILYALIGLAIAVLAQGIVAFVLRRL